MGRLQDRVALRWAAAGARDGGLGFASGFEEARKREYGFVRSTVCGVMHTPFYAWIGYGMGRSRSR